MMPSECCSISGEARGISRHFCVLNIPNFDALQRRAILSLHHRLLSSTNMLISTIVDMSQQISGAAEEQSVMAENIDLNVQQIIELGHETENNAQHTLEASDQLTSNTDILRQLIHTFKI